MTEGAIKAVLDTISSDSNKKKNTDSVEPKDFFWDHFVKYISSAIVALVLIDISIEFFRDGAVSCFHPSDTLSLLSSPSLEVLAVYEFARDQAAFINKYCVSSVPLTEYFPLFVLAHGLLLVVPHYIWSSIHKGDFDSFFSIAEKIERLRRSNTGEYSDDNFDRVKKLEKEYGGNQRKIFLSYIVKLFLQLSVCGISIGLSGGWLTDFSFSFDCPRSLDKSGIVPHGWPLNVTVPCVYTSLRILQIVRLVDFILTGVAGALIIFGLFWCAVRHTEQLGCQQIAKFTFQSCLKPDCFVFPPIIRYSGRKHLKLLQEQFEMSFVMKYLFWFTMHKIHSFKPRNCFHPAIRSDMDFLLLLLFRADASHGKVFKNVQVIQ